MRLQRVQTKGYNKVYVKYQVVIPNTVIQLAGWKPGDEIGARVDRKGRVVLFAQTAILKEPKPCYEEFRANVSKILHESPSGLSWSQIREKEPGLPRKPNALWVARLEQDIHLRRASDPVIQRKLWRLDPSRLGKMNGWVKQ